jgi:cation diffusion facilitator CzcD-associated flavoprotein CzcO
MITRMKPFDVVIVGAGAAGVGCGVLFRHLGLTDFTLLERRRIGASFQRWPKEMRFITPSFTSNSFGQTDLNAIAPYTSPAFTLQREHPNGHEYAIYLNAVADHYQLPVQTDVEVTSIEHADGLFTLDTNRGLLDARFVIWAAGEFQYPRLDPFPGAEHCKHNSGVRTWKNYPGGQDVIVIGGYESGLDAAIHLAELGKRVRVLEKSDVWQQPGHDPSSSLSTFTLERLSAARKTRRITLIDGVDVRRVDKHTAGGGYAVRGMGRQRWTTDAPPVLATGFNTSARRIAPLFEWREDGFPLLTEHDESTLAPGLFLAGPGVRQQRFIFCFIFKFRQRFAVIANQIARRLGADTAPLTLYRQHGMYLDDLSCCGDQCAC